MNWQLAKFAVVEATEEEQALHKGKTIEVVAMTVAKEGFRYSGRVIATVAKIPKNAALTAFYAAAEEAGTGHDESIMAKKAKEKRLLAWIEKEKPKKTIPIE